MRTKITTAALWVAMAALGVWAVVGIVLAIRASSASPSSGVDHKAGTNVGNLAGDTTGPPWANTVTGIEGRPISDAGPADGQALVWNGTAWLPASVVGGAGNAAFGPLVVGAIDASAAVVATATLTPGSTGQVAVNAGMQLLNDAGCGSEGGVFVVAVVPHGTGYVAGSTRATTVTSAVNDFLGGCVAGSATSVDGLTHDGGAAYDFFVVLSENASFVLVPDGSTGGIYVREVP